MTRPSERPATAGEPPARTERRNPKAAGLGAMTTLEIVTLMNDEDATVPAAVRAVLPDIARAADAIAAAFASGGRLTARRSICTFSTPRCSMARWAAALRAI